MEAMVAILLLAQVNIIREASMAGLVVLLVE